MQNLGYTQSTIFDSPFRSERHLVDRHLCYTKGILIIYNAARQILIPLVLYMYTNQALLSKIQEKSKKPRHSMKLLQHDLYRLTSS